VVGISEAVLWIVPMIIAAAAVLVALINPRLIWVLPERVRTVLGWREDEADQDVMTRVARGEATEGFAGEDKVIALVNLWSVRLLAAVMVTIAVGTVVLWLIE
jgi:hypothetical protein